MTNQELIDFLSHYQSHLKTNVLNGDLRDGKICIEIEPIKPIPAKNTEPGRVISNELTLRLENIIGVLKQAILFSGTSRITSETCSFEGYCAQWNIDTCGDIISKDCKTLTFPASALGPAYA